MFEVLYSYSLQQRALLNGVYSKYISILYFKCTATHAAHLKYTYSLLIEIPLWAVYLKYTARTVLNVYCNLCSIVEVYLFYTSAVCSILSVYSQYTFGMHLLVRVVTVRITYQNKFFFFRIHGIQNGYQISYWFKESIRTGRSVTS